MYSRHTDIKITKIFAPFQFTQYIYTDGHESPKQADFDMENTIYLRDQGIYKNLNLVIHYDGDDEFHNDVSVNLW